jgi:tRNA(Ile)-lysidine synthase
VSAADAAALAPPLSAAEATALFADLVSAPALILAVSGGPDSTALLWLAARWRARRKRGPKLIAVTVDHGLRPESAREAKQVARLARKLGIAHRTLHWSGKKPASRLQERARSARYGLLADAARAAGAAHVLTAHTLDDQAETVLLGLARGSGPDAVAGMRVVAPPLLRPLLAIPRAATVQACRDAALEAWADPHNADRRFARVRVRLDALPALEAAIGPGVAAALARTADQVQEDAAALDALAAELAPELAELADGGIALPVDALAANPPALRHRLIRLAMEGEFGVTLSRAQTVEIARLVGDWHGQGPAHLPGVRVERLAGRIRFTAV